jgi:hypothetical protein
MNESICECGEEIEGGATACPSCKADAAADLGDMDRKDGE